MMDEPGTSAMSPLSSNSPLSSDIRGIEAYRKTFWAIFTLNAFLNVGVKSNPGGGLDHQEASLRAIPSISYLADLPLDHYTIAWRRLTRCGKQSFTDPNGCYEALFKLDIVTPPGLSCGRSALR